jgi:hypothetical protein
LIVITYKERRGELHMLKMIAEGEEWSVTINERSKQVMLELSSGGYRSRYVTVHMNHEELERIITALQQAKAEIVGAGESL